MIKIMNTVVTCNLGCKWQKYRKAFTDGEKHMWHSEPWTHPDIQCVWMLLIRPSDWVFRNSWNELEKSLNAEKCKIMVDGEN